MMELNLIEAFPNHYGLEFAFTPAKFIQQIQSQTQKQLNHFSTFSPNIIIIIQLKSTLETEVLKTLKWEILNFIDQIKQKQKIKQILLVWNQQIKDLNNLNYLEIKILLQQFSQKKNQGTIKKYQKQQFSYKESIKSVRHAIQNIKKQLNPDHPLNIIFFSNQYNISQILIQGADPNQWKKWLFNYNSTKEYIEQQLQKLKKILQRLTKNTTIHTIGFGEYHDFNLLNKLRFSGNVNGTYQYAQSFSNIHQIFQGLIQTMFTLNYIVYTIPIDIKNQKKYPKQILKQLSYDKQEKQFTQTQCIFIQKQLGDLLLQKQQKYIQFHHHQKKSIKFQLILKKRQIQQKSQFLKLKIKYLDFLINSLIVKIPTVVQIVRQKDQKGKYIFINHYDQGKISDFVAQKKQILESIQYLNQIINKMKMSQKRNYIEEVISLRQKTLSIQSTFANIFKGQIQSQQFAKLVCSVDLNNLKNALKKKLLKRINQNPYMINIVFQKISQKLNNYNEVQLDNKYAYRKQQIGNCIISNRNFVKSIFQEDCLGVVFQLERPDTAIADPGRIVIKQVGQYVISSFQFIKNKDYQYYLKQKMNMKDKIVQRCNYSNYEKPVMLGVMPIYICDQNWQISKLMMKPCLGFTVTGQALAYTFSQMQMIPFLVLSKIIQQRQLLKYDIDQKLGEAQIFQMKKAVINKKTKQILKKQIKEQGLYHIEEQLNILKIKLKRLIIIEKAILQTCIKIIEDTSDPKRYQNIFSQQIIEKYNNYINPISRTIDIISNNYAFIAQIYCLIQMKIIKISKQSEFHQFFKRLVQQQLRRQTYGWKQQYVEDMFINKLLNAQIQKLQTATVICIQSDFRNRFYSSEEGKKLTMIQIQQKKNYLQVSIRKQDKYNDVQRMVLIQYKRLYEAKCLLFWYVRFLIYSQQPRISIHKWKCLDLTNSYTLFCLIIQNKLQRKNSVRRQTILRGEYVDPFNYYVARPYIQNLFLALRQKQEKKNLKFVIYKAMTNAIEVFGATEDTIQAAGALIGCTIDSNISKYYEQLLNNKCPMIHEKLKMFLKGTYKNVPVLNMGWKMSKKRTNALRNKYKRQFWEYQYLF